MTMKALSSSSIVAAIIEKTCAVLLKLLKACHRHLLQPSGENFDSRRCVHPWERGREAGRRGGGRGGEHRVGVYGKIELFSPKRASTLKRFVLTQAAVPPRRTHTSGHLVTSKRERERDRGIERQTERRAGEGVGYGGIARLLVEGPAAVHPVSRVHEKRMAKQSAIRYRRPACTTPATPILTSTGLGQTFGTSC